MEGIDKINNQIYKLQQARENVVAKLLETTDTQKLERINQIIAKIDDTLSQISNLKNDIITRQ